MNAEQNKKYQTETLCRSNGVEVRDGVRSSISSHALPLVTFRDDRK